MLKHTVTGPDRVGAARGSLQSERARESSSPFYLSVSASGSRIRPSRFSSLLGRAYRRRRTTTSLAPLHISHTRRPFNVT